MISEDVIQKIKDENDIIDVVSESVKLKKSGRYYSGLCPFHEEKTPSFTVTPEKQIFKCFGCGAAGNVISYVMRLKNISFLDAVTVLADRANIDISDNSEKDKNKKNTLNKYYSINVETARYFFNNLKNNKKSLEYFKNRNISMNTIQKFGLGYANDSWSDLLIYLKNKGYSELDLLSSGLICKSDKNRFYDRFRNRVMFPIFDYNGKVIGFGGRVLDDSKPKYLNSPESLIFKKGVNLYGLNFLLKNNANHNREIIIVEGYMDCISLHQAGIYNVVASLGTALTSNMAKLIKRYADRVIISYDSDNAGINAADRGLEVLKKEGLDVRILRVPNGKDPDEFIRKNTKEDFLYVVKNALPLTDYRIDRVKSLYNLSDNVGVTKYVSNVIEIIKDLDAVERDMYINRLSSETSIKETAIYDLMKKNIENNGNNSNVVNNDTEIGQKLYLEPLYSKGERALLSIMCKDSDICDFVTQQIDENFFIEESHKKLFNLIKENKNMNNDEKFKFIDIHCDDIESSKEWVNISNIKLMNNENRYEEFAADCIKDIKINQLEETKKRIMGEIKILEAQGKMNELYDLIGKFEKIQKEIGGIKL